MLFSLKNVLASFVFLICFSNGFSQVMQKNAYLPSDAVVWKKDSLQWSDFLAPQFFSSKESYKFHYYVQLGVDVLKLDKKRIQYPWAAIYSLRNLNFANSEFRSDSALVYMNGMMDILHYNELRFQKYLLAYDNLGSPMLNANRQLKVEYYNAEVNSMIKQYAETTDEGKDMQAVEKWRHYLDSASQAINVQVPTQFELRNFGVNIQMGFGALAHPGPSSKFANTSLLMHFGMGVLYKKWELQFLGSLSGSQSKQPVLDQYPWNQNRWLSLALGYINVGREILDNDNLRLTALAGYSVLNVETNNNEGDSYDFTNSGPCLGLSFDFKIRTSVFTLSRFGEIDEHCLRVAPMLSYYNIAGRYKSPVLAINIGWSLNGRMIKR
jgi:hypothetical protein